MCVPFWRGKFKASDSGKNELNEEINENRVLQILKLTSLCQKNYWFVSQVSLVYQHLKGRK
jgi:hypothetical protein